MTDILAGNTNPDVNPFWGEFAITNADGARRPATLKTGTNNDAKDLNAYGFIAPPTADGRAAGEYALAVGAWNGNSDNSVVSTPSTGLLDRRDDLRLAGLPDRSHRELGDQRLRRRRTALSRRRSTRGPGLQPPRAASRSMRWFIAGTEPKNAVPDGLCGSVVLDYVGFEKNFENWMRADRDWLARARRGPGTAGGVNGTPTRLLLQRPVHAVRQVVGTVRRGSRLLGPTPEPTCFPLPTPDASGVIPSFELPDARSIGVGRGSARPLPDAGANRRRRRRNQRRHRRSRPNRRPNQRRSRRRNRHRNPRLSRRRTRRQRRLRWKPPSQAPRPPDGGTR